VADSDMQAVIGHVMPDSAAAKAGIQDNDRIVKLNGKENPTWEDVGVSEVTSAYKPMYLTVERDGKRFDTVVTPTMGERSGFGLAGWDERGEIELGSVEPKMPAYKAGLRKGDLLVSVNGMPIHSQIKFQEITKNSGGKPIDIEYQRAGQKWLVRTLTDPKDNQWEADITWALNKPPQEIRAALQACGDTPQAIIENLRALDPLYDEQAQAMSLPYDQFQRDFPPMLARMKASPAYALLTVDFSRVYQQNAYARARMSLFRAAIVVVRDGPQAAKTTKDPFGDGPFAYRSTEGGFELSSKLAGKDGQPLLLKVGNPKVVP